MRISVMGLCLAMLTACGSQQPEAPASTAAAGAPDAAETATESGTLTAPEATAPSLAPTADASPEPAPSPEATHAASDSMAAIGHLEATCPGGVAVHADEGGPVRVGGQQARVKMFNERYYEASAGGVTVSVSLDQDGSPSVSYTGPGRANGMCAIR